MSFPSKKFNHVQVNTLEGNSAVVQYLSSSLLNANAGYFTSLHVGEDIPFDPTNYPTAATDAFQRIRISEATTIFDSQSQYDGQPLIFNTLTLNGGNIAHDINASSVLMTTTTDADSMALRQSKRYLRYQPGKSQLIFLTFTLAELQTNLYQEIGYGDDSNGIFFITENSEIFIMRRFRTTGTIVTERIAQADWNIDTFDGNGPSTITLDPTKSHILVIDLEWLGVGLVRVGFNIYGRTFYAHAFPHANLFPNVYMTTANLPVRWKIENTGVTAAPSGLRAICCSVMSEAGFENVRSLPFSTHTPVAGIGGVGTTEVAILGIRPKLTFKGQVNRVNIDPTEIYALALNAPVLIRVHYNSGIVGGSWVSVDDESTIEYNTTIASFTNGRVIRGAFIAAESGGGGGNRLPSSVIGGFFSQLVMSLDIAGLVQDNILITAQRVGPSGTATVVAGIQWLEQR